MGLSEEKGKREREKGKRMLRIIGQSLSLVDAENMKSLFTRAHGGVLYIEINHIYK